ncbi:MAG: 5-(carboxyamino)imidazole ribonucleotide mutase [Nitrosopumilus sp.]|nr:5-(carboxyamino)imidazole ribonucleotide mutase [Nitrosopumilus sp.]MDA7943620.1 5-(carboxyamino)imidazole ribonucleotide mutase [Nitrosopumilus sp.]MDA7999333.1 5-(carboxyamino)imidazole ribonucleotide mutase [Nitrosopumilus sp.]
MARGPLAGIIMGSSSDGAVMRGAAGVLDELGVPHEDMIISAHRTPDRIGWYARHAEEAGIRVVVAGAGGSAHLPGMVASHTVLPVVGVPIARGVAGAVPRGAPPSLGSSLGGLDALLSMSEMPTGTPVAVVGPNRAANAGLLAARIIALGSPQLQKRLAARAGAARARVEKESARLARTGLRGS